jgi:hypothetical protein
MIVGIGVEFANICQPAQARPTASARADRLFAQREQARPTRGAA